MFTSFFNEFSVQDLKKAGVFQPHEPCDLLRAFNRDLVAGVQAEGPAAVNGQKRVVPPDLADLDRYDTAGRDDDAFASMACAQMGVIRKFFADGSTIGPPADME